MRAVSDSLVIPQIIDFLKIATRKPTRAFMQAAVRRGVLPEATLAVSDAEFEGRLPSSCRIRASAATSPRLSPDHRGPRSLRDPPDPGLVRGRRPARAALRLRGRRAALRPRLHHGQFLSVTNRRTDAYGGSFENRIRLAREVIAAVRAAVGPDFLVGCRYLGSEDILADDGSIRATPWRTPSRSAWHWPRPGSTSCPSRAAASSTTRASRRWAKRPIPTPATAAALHPAAQESALGVNSHLAAGIRHAVRAAGFTIPVVTAGRIHRFEQAESLLAEGRPT
jgi:hypothetical protein